MSLKRSFRVLVAFCRVDIQEAMAYRLGGLAWVINGSIGNLFTMYIWTLVTPNKDQIITYFLGVILMFRLTGSWSFGRVSEGIKEGTLSQTLLKPYHYINEMVAHDMGNKVNRLMSMIPYIIILGVIFSASLEFPSVTKIFLSLPAIVLGYFINFLFGTCLGLLTNWTGDADGIGRTYEAIESLATGSLIPYILIPVVFRNILNFTPFRYFISFPLEILMGQLSNQQLVSGYSIMVAWCVGLIIFFKWIDVQSMKSFTAHGN